MTQRGIDKKRNKFSLSHINSDPFFIVSDFLLQNWNKLTGQASILNKKVIIKQTYRKFMRNIKREKFGVEVLQPTPFLHDYSKLSN